MIGLLAALQFLTRLPTPSVRIGEAEFVASMRWFPAAGLVIGGLVAGAAWIGALIDPWSGALAALAVWVLVTGGLHLDGLADLADASGAAHKGRDRILAVLRDPHIGSFGAIALGMQLLGKLVLLHGLIDRGAVTVLILVPAAARIAPIVWTLSLPPLHDGLAARFRAATRPGQLVPWGVLLLAACCYWPALAATPLLIAGWRWRLRRLVGGISGDGHGAGIELVETGLLIAALVMAALA